MRKRIAFIIAVTCVLLITGCGNSNSTGNPTGTDSQMAENEEQTDTEKNISTEGVADYPAAIMVNDIIYLLEGNPMPTEVDESAIIGYTESYTGTFPENNGETNFNPELRIPGIIIDHTLESLVPVICVRTLDEEIIPYEAVFFELPEGEEDWA